MGAVGRMMLVAEPLNGCGFDMARFGWKMEGKLEGDSKHQDALRQTRALTFTEPYEHASEIIVAVLWIPALTHGVGAGA